VLDGLVRVHAVPDERQIMNILSLIQGQLSPQTIGQISNTVGESPGKTESALGTAFPALLGSLMGKATASPGGATELYNTIKQGSQGAGWSDSIGSMISGTSAPPVGGQSQSLLNSLLGSKLGPVADFIAGHSGIQRGSASSLLGMAAPFLMGTISKLVSSQNLGPTGLGQLLASQAEHVKNALPSGLANTLGIGSLLSRGEGVAASTGRMAESTAARAEGGGILKWAWVPVVLALLAFLIIHRANRNRTLDNMGGASENYQTAAGHAHSAADFSKLNLTPGSAADRLAKAISSGDANSTIELREVNVDSAGDLTDSAKSSISQVGSVLSAAPDVRVRVSGRGSDQQAAQNQANAIKRALVSAGVKESRIDTSTQTGEGSPTISLFH
jgi:hypothetical protein